MANILQVSDLRNYNAQFKKIVATRSLNLV